MNDKNELYKDIFDAALKELQNGDCDSPSLAIGLRRMCRFVELDCEIDSSGLWEYFAEKADGTTGEISDIAILLNDFESIGASRAADLVKEGYDYFVAYSHWRVKRMNDSVVGKNKHWNDATDLVSSVEDRYRGLRSVIKSDIKNYIITHPSEFRRLGP